MSTIKTAVRIVVALFVAFFGTLQRHSGPSREVPIIGQSTLLRHPIPSEIANRASTDVCADACMRKGEITSRDNRSSLWRLSA